MGKPAPVDLLKEYTTAERIKFGVTDEQLADLIVKTYSAPERVQLGITDKMISDLVPAKAEITVAAAAAPKAVVPVAKAAPAAAPVPSVRA